MTVFERFAVLVVGAMFFGLLTACLTIGQCAPSCVGVG